MLDERFRELMRSGLFNLLQIKPTPMPGNLLRLDISAEEAKSKEFGFSVGYGSYVGGIFGVQFRDLDLFGYGRPLTTSLEISERSYKGEIAFEDPYLFDTDFQIQVASLRTHLRFRWLLKVRTRHALRLVSPVHEAISSRSHPRHSSCRNNDERYSAAGVDRSQHLSRELNRFHAYARFS